LIKNENYCDYITIGGKMKVRKIEKGHIYNFKDMNGVLRAILVKDNESAWDKIGKFLKIKPEVARMMGLI
jgi:hypothetical protein